MNLLYIGSGFVGACSAAVAAESGHETLVYDIDEKKIQMLGSRDRDTIESCLYEKGLGDLLVRNQERIHFTTDYAEVKAFLETCDAVFMCLPTPEIDETGESDLRFYTAAAEQLVGALRERNGGMQEKYVVLVNKSTVPIAMVDKTKELMETAGVRQIGVVSNPEFLVEGKAIEGSLSPDRIVVGGSSEKDFGVMRQIYQRFYDSPTVQYLEVNPHEAAAGKLLANYYLFNKLAVCFDVIGRTAELFPDVRFEAIRKILTNDPRIGSWGFYDSLYAGGSCFIKDARSLSYQFAERGDGATLVQETYQANKRQLRRFFDRAKTEAGMAWEGKTVALIGTAFKRDTNDIRNSPSIDLLRWMLDAEIKTCHVYDPAAMPMFESLFPASERVIYVSHEYEAIKDADVVIIATDWPQFRGLGDMLMAEQGKRPLILDGRRMLQHRYTDLQHAGFSIVAVGSAFLPAK